MNVWKPQIPLLACSELNCLTGIMNIVRIALGNIYTYNLERHNITEQAAL